MKIEENVTCKGNVEFLIEYNNGKPNETIKFPNTVLRRGRRAIALTLANQLGDEFSFYVTRMLFGDGGTTDEGIKKYVNSDRNGLFGVTQLSKPVLANRDINVDTAVIFTSVMTFDEAVGVVLNEIALEMANGDLYSMSTFPDFTKTDTQQIVIKWSIHFI